MVYLIVCSKTETCKIGYSTNPLKRLENLQTGNPYPLELIATIKGTVKDEQNLHKKFNHLSTQGEWFMYCKSVSNYFNVPKGKESTQFYEEWLPDDPTIYSIPETWEWLKNNTTSLEYKCAINMSFVSLPESNALKPLNDFSTIAEVSEFLGISKNLVTKTLTKLKKLGVYAKFEVYDPSKPYTKYWILNPYLSFNGKLIDSDIARLFSGTYIALAYKKIPFVLILN